MMTVHSKKGFGNIGEHPLKEPMATDYHMDMRP